MPLKASPENCIGLRRDIITTKPLTPPVPKPLYNLYKSTGEIERKPLQQIYSIGLRLTVSMISGLFDHAEDRSEPSGATLSFLPLLPATGMFTHKFHPSFRSMLTVFKTGHLLLFEYWATFTSGFCYTRISPFHYSTACFGVSAKFAFTSLQKVSRIFLAFRASVYCRCQNPSCLNRHQDPHIPFCVAF